MPPAKPRLLDLFCGAGGAGTGYVQAGFDVFGVDITRQPYYQMPYARCDAIEYLQTEDLSSFDFIHASPPCGRYSKLNVSLHRTANQSPDLIDIVRELLEGTGKPWVIENVMTAPLRNPFMLCGSMFKLRIPRGYLQRHRNFEANWSPGNTPQCDHYGYSIGVYGHGSGGGYKRDRTANADEARLLMGMPWSNREGVAQAIPPAYTLWIGTRAIQRLPLVSPQILSM